MLLLQPLHKITLNRLKKKKKQVRGYIYSIAFGFLLLTVICVVGIVQTESDASESNFLIYTIAINATFCIVVITGYVTEYSIVKLLIALKNALQEFCSGNINRSQSAITYGLFLLSYLTRVIGSLLWFLSIIMIRDMRNTIGLGFALFGLAGYCTGVLCQILGYMVYFRSNFHIIEKGDKRHHIQT